MAELKRHPGQGVDLLKRKPALFGCGIHGGNFRSTAGHCRFYAKAAPYSKRVYRVLELIPVLSSQSAGDRSHKPGGRLPLLSARPAVTFPAAEHRRPLAGTKLYCLVTEARV